MSEQRAGLGLTAEETSVSAVSWAAIAAGASAAAALTLALVALGVGLGLSAVSPWSNSGPSATTFQVTTGIYLCVVAMLASTVGGYLAGRLRTKWTGLHTNEVVFRDTAHGFLAWAFATVVSAAVLGSATTTIVGGAAPGAAPAAAAASQSSGVDTGYFVDALFRADAPAGQPAGDPAAQRAEASRIFAKSIRDGSLNPADRAYLAKLVSARTGLAPADAEKRVDEVDTNMRNAIDAARRAAAHLALWLTASLFIGAFAASLAALEGGQLRDDVWDRSFRGRRPRDTAVVS
ncbi:MAG: hypothetical protein JO328_16765 [Hyphomicrobiales bacterium]|nr:hypothetical protein [Hyphomicrobiales bacterium]MBV8824897.1 hypothetical protein [Hyphomicrobiales bacterium]MBV9428350.1 hypothetical protein [Bradyrhizobiaceae bacterium]